MEIGDRGKIMLRSSVIVVAFAVRLFAGQAGPAIPTPLDEAGFRKAVQDGLPVPDNLAGLFALNHEEIAIPILVDAIKATQADNRTENERPKKLFIREAATLITYRATQRAIDAVAGLCARDQNDCAEFVSLLFAGGRNEEHPYATAYQVVEQYPNLREFMLVPVKEALRVPEEARFFADDVLEREKAGHRFSDNDAIMSGLPAEMRERIHKAVEKARKDQ
jgi:hypothetical protein